MEARTEAHPQTAARHQVFARALLTADGAALVSPPPRDWAVVAAFYAAVHYVNAYLWERQRYEPRTHSDRLRAVARVAALRFATLAYPRLRQLAQDARYTPNWRPPPGGIDAAIRIDLPAVASTVQAALGSGT